MARKLLASAVAVLWIFSICEVPRRVMSEEQICSDDVYPQEESPDPTPGKLVCPALPPDAVGVCAELCPAKGCPKGYLCCSNGCGHVCKKGVPSKPYPADEDDGGDEPGNNKNQDCSSSPCPYDKMCVTYDKACGTTGKLGKRTCGTGRACVPKNSGCTVMRCGFGTRCGWKEVYCKKAPCLPVASCLPPSPPPRYEQVDEDVQSADDESVIEEEDPAADEDYVPVATKPPQPQYSYRECSSSRPCPSGRRCATYEKSCTLGKNGKVTCTTGKACVPNDYSGCAAITCAARSRCALREAPCTQKLCYPKAICIPIDGKPNGNYQQTPSSTTAAPIVPKPSPVSVDGGFGQQPCKRACARGEKCVNVEQQCKRPPADEYDPKITCRFKQECVLLNFQGCAAAEARCRRKGQRCRLRAVQCITTPCNPVPICE